MVEGEKQYKFEEILPIYKQVSADAESGTFADFMEAFKTFDREGQGFINAAELRHVLTSLGMRPTATHVAWSVCVSVCWNTNKKSRSTARDSASSTPHLARFVTYCDTIRYRNINVRSKADYSSQLNLAHGNEEKKRKKRNEKTRTKNAHAPRNRCQYEVREVNPAERTDGLWWEGFLKNVGFEPRVEE